MKRFLLLLFPILLLFASCGISLMSFTEYQYKAVKSKIDMSKIEFSIGDGSTKEKAIVITGIHSDTEAIISEQLYIEKRLGKIGKDWSIAGESELNYNGTYYNIMDAKLPKDDRCSTFFFNVNCLADEKQIAYMQEKMALRINVQAKIAKHEIYYTGGDGLSIENPIIIMGDCTEEEAVIAEQAYLAAKIGVKGLDWQFCGQSLLQQNGKWYDLFEISLLKENKNEGYYFDISNYYGKAFKQSQ